MQHKIILILLVILTSGCASTHFADGLAEKEYLFQTNYSVEQAGFLLGNDGQISATFGKFKTGFIKPDISKERIDFEKSFPIQKPSLDDYEALLGLKHKLRVGQVLIFSADLDTRTSGIIKDEKGYPISVSGKFELDQNRKIADTSVSSGMAGVAVGSLNASAINSQLAKSGMQLTPKGQSAVIASSAITGLVAGMISGAIASQQIETALDGIVNKSNFGDRMAQTTSTAQMPHAYPIAHNGAWNAEKPIRIADGIVKRIFCYHGELDTNYKRDIFFISTVAIFRGIEYANKYPNTLGWEYQITNLNAIKLAKGIDRPSAFDSAETYYRAIKKALLDSSIFL
jgi:hypothetical protein